jgi:hypothetical protein
MSELVRFPLEDDGSVLVEVEEPPGVTRVARPGDLPKTAKETFEKALLQVRDVANVAFGQLRSMSRQPDEIEIKFGVKLDAQAGAVIARTGVQGHLEVKLKWQRAAVPPAEAEETV